MKLIDKAIKIKKELDLFNKENEDVCTVSGNNIALEFHTFVKEFDSFDVEFELESPFYQYFLTTKYKGVMFYTFADSEQLTEIKEINKEAYEQLVELERVVLGCNKNVRITELKAQRKVGK